MRRSLACLAALLSLPAGLQASNRFERTQILMGNVSVTLTVEAPVAKKNKAVEAMTRAFDEAKRIENEISEWRPGSEATRLNQNAGKRPVPIGRDMTAILLKAKEVSEITDGAFDITFSSKKRKISYRDVLLFPEKGLAYLRPGVKIGVSSVAKGFIVDRMSEVLRGAGFRKFLVNAGDLYAAGRWRIVIRDPDRPGGDQGVCEVTVQDRAVSTSGQYERGPHIIDPKTGQPAAGLKSVTVIAKKSIDASPLATGFFVLGKEKAETILAKRTDVTAMFVANDEKKIIPSPCLSESVQ